MIHNSPGMAMAKNHNAVIGPNSDATLAVPRALKGEQRDEDQNRDRQNVRMECGRSDIETFNGRKHR